MKTGLEGNSLAEVQTGILGLKKSVMLYVNEPDYSVRQTMAENARLAWSLLETFEAELFRRGEDPRDAKFGEDLVGLFGEFWIETPL